MPSGGKRSLRPTPPPSPRPSAVLAHKVRGRVVSEWSQRDRRALREAAYFSALGKPAFSNSSYPCRSGRTSKPAFSRISAANRQRAPDLQCK